jgi:hypothetical protein
MTLSDIQSAVYDRLGYNATPGSEIVRRLNRYINDSHRAGLAGRQMGVLRRAVLTFSSVASSPFAVLPQAAVQVLAIADRTTNRILDEITLQDLRARDPGLNFASTIPDAYTIISYAAAVARDPSAATQLYAVSDDTRDGIGLSVYVEGTITGGAYRRASVTMNGTTPVALDSSTAWEHVTKFYTSGKGYGTITLTEGSGGTVLATIQPARNFSRYTQIHFSGTPVSAATYYADVELHIDDMIHPRDEPYFPEDFHYILEAGCLRKEYLKRQRMDQYKVEQMIWDRGLADMRAWVTRRSGVARSSKRTRQFTQLPWNFRASPY